MNQAFSFEFSKTTRRNFKRVYDVCVIGGGITGAAIAREAQSRGLDVILLEKDDFASGTSSRSSKLVHGGVRYLEQFEFGLVHESTRERALLWRNAPDLVTAVPFIFPAFRESRVPLWKLNIGLWLYDLLALFRTPTRHYLYSKAKTLREEPGLRSDGLRGSIFYWDGQTDDARLTLSNIIDAARHGAHVLPQAEAMRVQQDDTKKFYDIHFRDQLSGEFFLANARIVVGAPGPWTDSFSKRLPIKLPKIIKQTRGSHLLFRKESLPVKHAVVLQHPQDGRVMFSIPWSEFTIIGTTDLYDVGLPEDVAITPVEVDYIIEAANYYFPAHPVTQADVVSTWSGLRPLVAPPSAEGSEGEISREHFLHWWDPGVILMTGGKLTTHREMAEECVDLIFTRCMDGRRELSTVYRPSRTDRFPLQKPTFPKSSTTVRVGDSEASALSTEDIIGICRTQMPLQLEDLLVRRTQLFYKERDNGIQVANHYKKIIMQELGWDEAHWTREMTKYISYLDKNVRRPLKRKS
jgi:glycerol-3-phosphate dehydrogenase